MACVRAVVLFGLVTAVCGSEMSTSIGEQFCKEYAHLHLCRLQDNLEGALAEIQYLVNSDVAAPVTSVINKRKSAFVRFGKRPNNEEDDEKPDENSQNEKPTADQFDIGEYERKLRQNTQETINLLTNLCDFSDRLKQQQKSTLIRLQEEQIRRYQATEQMQKVMQTNSQLCERRDQLEKEVELLKKSTVELKKAAQLSAGVEWHNVDCVRIGECFLREPGGAIVLPNTSIFVTDSQLGLFLFSLNSDLIRNVSNVDWRWAQGAALLPNGHLLVSMMVRESSAVPWRRFIMKFDSDLNFVAKVEGPKWIEEETILRERLCAASNGNIYFAVAGETFSALYELSPDAKWTELEHKRGQTFIDVQVLVVVGPVTGLLLVEERRGCVCLYGIRE